MAELTSTNKNHQITAFFLLTFAITWGIGIFAIFFPGQFEALFGELNGSNPIAILAVAAPTISATILTLAQEGWSGLGRLYAHLIQWRVGIQWYALILLGIPFLGWLATLFTGPTPVYNLSTPGLIFPALLNLLIAGPLIEESGWRGYALPRLLKRFSPFVASLILGAIWGGWHLPSFFISSRVQSGLSLPIFLFMAICTFILLTWIFKHTGGSVLIAVLFHYAVNFSLSIIGASLLVFGTIMVVPTILVVVLEKRFGWVQKVQGIKPWKKSSNCWRMAGTNHFSPAFHRNWRGDHDRVQTMGETVF